MYSVPTHDVAEIDTRAVPGKMAPLSGREPREGASRKVEEEKKIDQALATLDNKYYTFLFFFSCLSVRWIAFVYTPMQRERYTN